MTRFLKTRPLLLAAGLVAAATFSNPVLAGVTNPYPTELQEVLTQYNIDEENIRSQRTLVKYIDENDGQRIAGYDTYIRFEDCKGYLRIFQHRFGRVEQVYTRGECQIPGVENF